MDREEALKKSDDALAELAEACFTREAAVGIAFGIWGEGRDHVNVVGGEPEHTESIGDSLFDILILPHVPVLVVADADHRFDAAQICRFEVVCVRAVGDVVAFFLQPVAKRIFPEQKLAAAHAEWVIKNLHILAVRPVKAATDARRMSRTRIGVERFVHRPTIVGLPSVVAALEEDVSGAIIFDDEDDVALPIRFLGNIGHCRKTTKINAAGPVGRNGE